MSGVRLSGGASYCPTAAHNQYNIRGTQAATPSGIRGMTPREQEILRRTELSETRVTKAVFPPTTNHHNTLFGGTALAWMDEVSFITATRFCRLPLVTVSTDRIDFNHPIPAGSIVELVGRVVKVGNTSLKVEVEVYLESMYADGREKAIHGLFSFVAIDDEKRPVPVLPGFPASQAT